MSFQAACPNRCKVTLIAFLYVVFLMPVHIISRCSRSTIHSGDTVVMMMITMLILEHKGRPPHPTQASGSDPLEKMFAQFLFHYFLCVFQKLNIFCVTNAQCLVSSVLNMCTRFPYIALNFTPKCWIEAGGQCWTWEQIGGGWLVGMPMTKMPKSRDSHNATRRSHNAMWARDNSRNMMRSKLQATSQAPWEAKREADVSIQFC